jgi:hypothetical protein
MGRDKEDQEGCVTIAVEQEFKNVTSVQHMGGYAIRIQIQGIEREFTEDEKFAIDRARDSIDDALLKGETGANPKTHEKAACDKAKILECFGRYALYVEEIPNGYCSRGCCAFYPWFIVTTPKGRIKIGWRKSVIHLEWTDSEIKADASEIFPKEEAWPGYETTQYDHVIHAHGYEAAKSYIDRLMVFDCIRKGLNA